MEGVIKWLAFSLLAVFGLLILAGVFFGVLFPKTTMTTKSGLSEIASKIIGKEKILAGDVFVEPGHLQAIDYFKTRLVAAVDSVDDNCYVNYAYAGGSDDGRNGFPILGEKGTSLILAETAQGLRLTIIGGAEGLQEYSSEIIEGVKPCVISGGSVPANFYNKFVTGRETGTYFNPVTKIRIKYDLSGHNENRISYDSSSFFDFEDGGLLFKKGNNLCFFPTVDDGLDLLRACDGSSSEGLDDDCLGIDKRIISLSPGRLQQCRLNLRPPGVAS